MWDIAEVDDESPTRDPTRRRGEKGVAENLIGGALKLSEGLIGGAYKLGEGGVSATDNVLAKAGAGGAVGAVAGLAGGAVAGTLGGLDAMKKGLVGEREDDATVMERQAERERLRQRARANLDIETLLGIEESEQSYDLQFGIRCVSKDSYKAMSKPSSSRLAK